MWAKGETMKESIVIGKEEGGLYKLKGHSETAMTHAIENPCELWHRRLLGMCYILCMCVCVGASDTTTVSDDPLRPAFGAAPRNFFLGGFCYF